MKKLFISALCITPIAAVLFSSTSPDLPETISVETKEEPEQISASVLLSKWQVEKMMRSFNDDDHPSDMRVFTSVVNNSADGWRISSTHLVRNPKNVILPTTDYHVIDSSYIDFSGNLRECVEYARSYKGHHDYIVVPLK
jgi:hypothetical protein